MVKVGDFVYYHNYVCGCGMSNIDVGVCEVEEVRKYTNIVSILLSSRVCHTPHCVHILKKKMIL